MEQCPFCELEFTNMGELERHVVRLHPEKTQTAEAYGQALEKITHRGQIAQIAASLTAIAIGAQGAPVDVVLGIYRDIYQKISEWV